MFFLQSPDRGCGSISVECNYPSSVDINLQCVIISSEFVIQPPGRLLRPLSLLDVSLRPIAHIHPTSPVPSPITFSRVHVSAHAGIALDSGGESAPQHHRLLAHSGRNGKQHATRHHSQNKLTPACYLCRL